MVPALVRRAAVAAVGDDTANYMAGVDLVGEFDDHLLHSTVARITAAIETLAGVDEPAVLSVLSVLTEAIAAVDAIEVG